MRALTTSFPAFGTVESNMAANVEFQDLALSYTILLEEVLAEKKCPQKHGGFSPEMTPLPWLLVPPAHEKTTDQAQN